MPTYSRDQYTKLVAALATGATFVKYSDKEVHYRDFAEMQSLKHDMEVDLGIIKSGSRTRYGDYRKGLGGRRRC